MAGVMGGAAHGRRSIAVFVVLLCAVLAAIVYMSKLSRRHGAHAPAPVATETDESQTAPAPPTGGEGVAAAAAAPAQERAEAPDDQATIERRQHQIERVINDGRGGLSACYERALVRDPSIVSGNLKVRVWVAPSGRVEHVNVNGPASFRPVEPCLQRAVSKWTFPGAAEAYEAEFPLRLEGRQ